MNYFIAFIRKDEFEWCVFETTDEKYAYKVFDDLCAPPGYNMELRCTPEPIETYRSYGILKFDYSQFSM